MEERSERIIEKRRDKKYFAPFLSEKFISGRRSEAVLSSLFNILASEKVFFKKHRFVSLIVCDFLEKLINFQ
jgi:hypothetical protein